MRLLVRATLAVAALALGACTVKQTTAPPLSGPSEFATSINVTATPDSITQDGASQSAIAVVARDPNGRPISGVPIRLDIMVGGVVQDFGSLSTKSIVTGTDGRAASVYTAPPAPPPGSGGSGTKVSIMATPTGSNFQASQTQTVDIRLVPTGVILPPAGTPTASFTITPTPVTQGTSVMFDASASTIGTGATQITSYSWTFGDGANGSGKTVSHSFSSPGTYTVTLTVTNDRSLSASTSQPVAVNSVTAPTAVFVFSPAAPSVGQTVIFNADQSVAAPGHTITGFTWDFGDGATATGFSTSHAYAAAGTFTVLLVASDDVGQKGTTAKTVTVTAGPGGSVTPPKADFVFSPAAPSTNQTIQFNASTSSAASGHSLTSYSWNFGDGATSTGITPSHAYSVAGTYNVVLTVTDDTGQTANTTKSVGITPTSAGGGALTASFTFSPSAPGVGESVFFNASGSTAAPGRTITSYQWTFGDGDVGTGSSTTHQFRSAGDFSVLLRVTDDAGNSATSTNKVSVTTGTPSASFTISPTSPGVNQAVYFNASASTAGAGTITGYAWDFGDGLTGTGVTTSHAYTRAGSFVVVLTVTNSAGRANSVSSGVTVSAASAQIVADFVFSPTNPSIAGGTNDVYFDATPSSAIPPNTIVRYDWDFGDGTTASLGVKGTNHLYTRGATYVVRLTVTDNTGATATTTKNVTVSP